MKLAIAVALGILAGFGGEGRALSPVGESPSGEILITDIAQRAGRCAWTPMEYETQSGIKGTLLYAAWGMEPRQKVEIPLPAKGRYRISLGLAATRYALADSPYEVLVKLARDPAPVYIGAETQSRSAGWWWQPVEVEWKVVDLADDVLVVENPRNANSVLAWVRLVPDAAVEDGGGSGKRFVATNDAYKPAFDLDELCAPIMRFAHSPVKAIYYCVGNGPFLFAVPGKVAYVSAGTPGAHLDNPYARDCARGYEKLHREHPHLVDELADFAHSVGLEYHVSFRTGCALDCMTFDSQLNRADPGTAGHGILGKENFCRLWNGKSVARFSYASQEVQDFFLKFYAEMLTEKVDGINLIFIRALPAMLFEPAFRERFRAAYGEELASQEDGRIVPLRKAIMTDFLRKVRAIAGKKRVSIVVPAKGELCESFGLDIARLAKEGIVDEVDVGDSLQTARHDESGDFIEHDYFRKALAGTGAVFLTFQWDFGVEPCAASISKGAAGVMFWDGGEKRWSHWRRFRPVYEAAASAVPRPAPAWSSVTRDHPLRTLNGFDMEHYPWHVAY